MKKQIIFIPMLLTSTMALGAQTIMLYGGGTSMLEAKPYYLDMAKYYKCTNDIAFNCKDYAGIIVTFTMANTSTAGTASAPYLLSGCTKVECACAETDYNTGSKCAGCTKNRRGLPASTDRGLHTNTACHYCQSGYWHSQGSSNGAECSTCPSNATCDGSVVFKCNVGWYKADNSACAQCPIWTGVYTTIACTTQVRGTSPVGTTAITGCYVAPGTYYDRSGTFKITDNCPYK